MKTSLRIALFLSLGTGALVAVEPGFTTPVGMVTLEGAPPSGGHHASGLQPGMNLVGLRVHHNTLIDGRIDTIGSDFAELHILDGPDKIRSDLPLIVGKTYILEITSGDMVGVIQEVTHWQGVRLVLSDDLAAAGVKAGDTFSLRNSATLNSVFDPRTPGLLSGENPDFADNVLIPQGSTFADFRRFFLLRLPDGTSAWVDVATFKPAGDEPLVYADGLIFHRKGDTALSIMMAGAIKTGPTRSVVKPGINLVATPFPASTDLQSLGLESDLGKSDDPNEADRVWVMDNAAGGFTIYFLTTEDQWINAGNGEAVSEKIPVGSAVLIERKGAEALFCLGD